MMASVIGYFASTLFGVLLGLSYIAVHLSYLHYFYHGYARWHNYLIQCKGLGIGVKHSYRRACIIGMHLINRVGWFNAWVNCGQLENSPSYSIIWTSLKQPKFPVLSLLFEIICGSWPFNLKLQHTYFSFLTEIKEYIWFVALTFNCWF